MYLLTYNIRYGFGSNGRYDLPRTAAVINGVDIACLQEVDRHWQRTNHNDHMRYCPPCCQIITPPTVLPLTSPPACLATSAAAVSSAQ